jgi:hypothetical protein
VWSTRTAGSPTASLAVLDDPGHRDRRIARLDGRPACGQRAGARGAQPRGHCPGVAAERLEVPRPGERRGVLDHGTVGRGTDDRRVVAAGERGRVADVVVVVTCEGDGPEVEVASFEAVLRELEGPRSRSRSRSGPFGDPRRRGSPRTRARGGGPRAPWPGRPRRPRRRVDREPRFRRTFRPFRGAVSRPCRAAPAAVARAFAPLRRSPGSVRSGRSRSGPVSPRRSDGRSG